MYEYKATVVAVYDGDTITADVDLGFKSFQRGLKFRLFGIDAPEVRGEERADGVITRDWLRERILGKEVVIHSHKDSTGKYGRWLADVFPLDDQSKSYNQMMVEEGLAEAKTY